MRDVFGYSELRTRLSKIGQLHEDLWERAITPEKEQRSLDDFIVLSPVSSGRSPLSASRADQGFLYKIEMPFRYLWQRASAIFIALFLVLSESITIPNPFKSKKRHNHHSSTPRVGQNTSVRNSFLIPPKNPSND
jgi:hypothetical protein